MIYPVRIEASPSAVPKGAADVVKISKTSVTMVIELRHGVDLVLGVYHILYKIRKGKRQEGSKGVWGTRQPGRLCQNTNRKDAARDCILVIRN